MLAPMERSKLNPSMTVAQDEDMQRLDAITPSGDLQHVGLAIVIPAFLISMAAIGFAIWYVVA